MKIIVSHLSALTLVLSLMLISACGSNDDYDALIQKLDDIQARPKGRIPPPPEFKAFEIFTYQSAGLRSPFERPLLDDDFKPPVSSGRSVKPDDLRRKEALEKFSLDAMSYVGTLEHENDSTWAIVDDGQGGVHRVTSGNFLGKNNGKIVNIEQRRIELLEIIPSGQLDDDGNKLWIERPRSLVLRD